MSDYKSNPSSEDECRVDKLKEAITSLNVKLSELYTENKELKITLEDLQRQMGSKEEKAEKYINKLRQNLKESQQKVSQLESELKTGSQTAEVQLQQNLEVLRANYDGVLKERDELVRDRKEITLIISKLEILLGAACSKEEPLATPDIGLVAQVRKVEQSATRELNKSRKWMKRFEEFSNMTRDMSNNTSSSPFINNTGGRSVTPATSTVANSGQSTSSTSKPSTQQRSRSVRKLCKIITRQRTKFAKTTVEHHQVDECFSCSCKATFSGKLQLMDHIRKMTKEWKYFCGPCRYYFFYKSSLRYHQVTLSCLRNRRGGSPERHQANIRRRSSRLRARIGMPVLMAADESQSPPEGPRDEDDVNIDTHQRTRERIEPVDEGDAGASGLEESFDLSDEEAMESAKESTGSGDDIPFFSCDSEESDLSFE